MSKKLCISILSLTALLGLTGGLYIAKEASQPQIVQAYTMRVNLSLDRQPNESYETIVRRAEAIARAAVQRSFDSDILVNNASIIVTCDNNGLIAPIISVKVSRSQWSNTPDIQRWTRYYSNSRTLLSFDSKNQSASASASSANLTICDSNRDPIGKPLCELAELLLGKEKFQAATTGAVSAKPEEVEILGTRCIKTVPVLLKAPATAQFPEKPIVGEAAKGVYVVSGKVDSQNSFGALLRGSYTCIYRNTPQKGIESIYTDVQ